MGLAVALAMTLTPAWVRGASRGPTRLLYQRAVSAADCPDEESLRAGVAGRLGYDPFADTSPSLVAVALERSGETLEASIEITGADPASKARRRLASRRGDCTELAAAVELAVAMAIDPLGVARPAPTPVDAPPPPPARPPPPQAVRIVVVKEGPAHDDRPRDPINVQAAMGVVGAMGAAPANTLGGTLQLALRRGRMSLALEGRADMTATASLRTGAIEASLLTVGVAPCLHHGIFAGCALATGGALRAAGSGLVDPRQVSISFFAVGVRAEAEIPLGGPVFLRFHGDVLASLSTVVLRVSGEPVWTSPPLSAVLGLGAGLRFL